MPLDYRTELQTLIEMPDVLSPGRSFMQPATSELTNNFTTNPVSTCNENMASNHDFLAAIPLSPKENDSDCNLSDLSSSFWSAKISVKLDYEFTHDKHKMIIPLLDLSNLPPDSDDEGAM